MKRRFFIAAILLSPVAALAQYWSDYVLEKAFDPRDYFLRPHRILSLSLKNLDAGLLGILPDPLSEMSFQPATLSSISGARLYIDLKGSSEKNLVFKNRFYPIYAYDNAVFAPPYWGQPVERKLEPVLSAIYIGDIAATFVPGFKYAVAYELIHHRGTFYEYIPFYYLRGYDAFGAEDAASKNFPDLDPNVKRDGLDEKAETAHLMDAYLSLKLAPFLSVGGKVGRIQTEVVGDYLRLNRYDDMSSTYRYNSFYLDEKNKDVSLEQTEYSAGALLTISDSRQIGAFAGRITGNHTQRDADIDSSFSAWGDESQSDYFGRWRYSHLSHSRWQHRGTTRYAGVHGQLPMQGDIAVRFRAEYLKSSVDLSNGDDIADTSYSRYRFRYYEDNQIYDEIWSSNFSDRRSGSGTEETVQRTAAAGLVVPMYRRSELVIGAFVETAESSVLLYEDALVRRGSHQETPTPWRQPESVLGFEDKTLRLTRNTKTARLALPIAMSFYLGRGFTANLGVVKQFNEIDSDEMVDIWFRADSTVTITPGGKTVIAKPERIDRYFAVPVHRSDTSTDFNFGATFEPGRRVRFDVGMGSSLGELKNWQFAVLLKL